MSLFLSMLLSSVVQIIAFSVLPFTWWWFTARKDLGFFEWIGFKKMAGGKKTIRAIVILSLSFLVLGAFVFYSVRGSKTAVSEFAGLGIQALPAIFVYAIFHTALPEELFFRGFLLKRLSHTFGFAMANSAQAFLFGLLHGVLFFTIVGIPKAILIVALTGLNAWFMGIINENYAEGSIWPSWVIHSLANIFAGVGSAFQII